MISTEFIVDIDKTPEDLDFIMRHMMDHIKNTIECAKICKGSWLKISIEVVDEK